tara:strand:+ start:401 stop:994 length:594 start_codon:yes stop_codon:yes gene_type:complete
MNLYSLILISFISSSIPWSLILGYVFSKKDIREVGDNNPGGTNALKLSGIRVGLMAIFLDISKSFFPIYVTIKNDFEGIELFLICVSAISGSIFSPFLKFKGGKSLSVTCGLWLAISSGIIGPLICIMMAFSHLIQKTHFWTIMFGWLGILIWVLLFSFKIEYLFIYLFNFFIVMYKHKKEFDQKIIFRNWVRLKKA